MEMTYQNPLERLRKKLTPFFKLAEMTANDDGDKEELLRLARSAKGFMKDVEDHLDDIQEMLDESSEEVPEWESESRPPSSAEREQAMHLHERFHSEEFENELGDDDTFW